MEPITPSARDGAAAAAAFGRATKGEIACLLQITPQMQLRRRISLGCSLLLQAMLLGMLIGLSRPMPVTAFIPPPLEAHVQPLWLAPARLQQPRPRVQPAVRLRRRQALPPRPTMRRRRIVSATPQPRLPAPPARLLLRTPLARLAWSRPAAVRSPLRLGSFGSPRGLVPVRTPPTPPNVAALGAFASTRLVAAAAASGEKAGELAGGFAAVRSQAPAGRGRGRIRITGFTTLRAATQGKPRRFPRRQLPAARRLTPPRILYKPRPHYPALARARRLQGEVVLEALLRASGQVQVLRIVHRLGDGLDRSARAAAEGIRFLPARLNHRPVDWKVYLYISFRLLE